MTHSDNENEESKERMIFQATFDVAEITADTELTKEQLDCVIKAWEAGASYAMKLAKQILQEQA